jgi:thiazole synthase ThiGH ThiG subunit
VRLGFQGLPYCTEDWVLCRRLLDAGCEVPMPWAAPIGTGQGPRNRAALRELRQRASHIPLIIDAGIGLPSHACQVMEWGFDGLLLNTAISRAIDPVLNFEVITRHLGDNTSRVRRSTFESAERSIRRYFVSTSDSASRQTEVGSHLICTSPLYSEE